MESEREVLKRTMISCSFCPLLCCIDCLDRSELVARAAFLPLTQPYSLVAHLRLFIGVARGLVHSLLFLCYQSLCFQMKLHGTWPTAQLLCMSVPIYIVLSMGGAFRSIDYERRDIQF